jgi:hypothetical protein
LDKGGVNGFLVDNVEVSWGGGLDNGRVNWDSFSSGLGELKLVGVSVNDNKVLRLVFWGNWHELSACLGELKLVSVSLNNSEILWLVFLSDWHEFGIGAGSNEVNLIKSNWDINESKVCGGLSVLVNS